jgi:hypothetical protein
MMTEACDCPVRSRDRAVACVPRTRLIPIATRFFCRIAIDFGYYGGIALFSHLVAVDHLTLTSRLGKFLP